ncbi:MAG: hypothetical protein O9266_10130 [Porphyrobacter sp.]|jgi:uncharacterized protein|nr:hypothetical protein [Porphyrobacter sp.]
MTSILATGVLAALALTQSAQPAAVPPPVEQASADCTYPVYASDQLVCSDPALRAQDQKLAALIAAAPLVNQRRLIEGDTDWFSRSRRCAFAADHRACLESAYRERIAVRAALAEAPATQGEALLCRSGDSSRGMILAPAAADPAALVLRNRSSGETHAVVFAPAAEGAPWQPFASYKRRGERVRFTSLQGVLVACKTSPASPPAP